MSSETKNLNPAEYLVQVKVYSLPLLNEVFAKKNQVDHDRVSILEKCVLCYTCALSSIIQPMYKTALQLSPSTLLPTRCPTIIAQKFRVQIYLARDPKIIKLVLGP